LEGTRVRGTAARKGEKSQKALSRLKKCDWTEERGCHELREEGVLRGTGMHELEKGKGVKSRRGEKRREALKK